MVFFQCIPPAIKHFWNGQNCCPLLAALVRELHELQPSHASSVDTRTHAKHLSPVNHAPACAPMHTSIFSLSLFALLFAATYFFFDTLLCSSANP